MLDDLHDAVAEADKLRGVGNADHRRSIDDDAVIAALGGLHQVGHLVRVHQAEHARAGNAACREEVEIALRGLDDGRIELRFADNDVGKAGRKADAERAVLSRVVKVGVDQQDSFAAFRTHPCGVEGVERLAFAGGRGGEDDNFSVSKRARVLEVHAKHTVHLIMGEPGTRVVERAELLGDNADDVRLQIALDVLGRFDCRVEIFDEEGEHDSEEETGDNRERDVEGEVRGDGGRDFRHLRLLDHANGRLRHLEVEAFRHDACLNHASAGLERLEVRLPALDFQRDAAGNASLGGSLQAQGLLVHVGLGGGLLPRDAETGPDAVEVLAETAVDVLQRGAGLHDVRVVGTQPRLGVGGHRRLKFLPLREKVGEGLVVHQRGGGGERVFEGKGGEMLVALFADAGIGPRLLGLPGQLKNLPAKNVDAGVHLGNNGDAVAFAQLAQPLLLLVNLAVDGLEVRLQLGDAELDRLARLVADVVFVDFGNRVGNARGDLGRLALGLVRLVEPDLNGDQVGVAPNGEVGAALHERDGPLEGVLRGARRLPAVFHPELFLQVPLSDDLLDDRIGLDDFELGAKVERVVAQRPFRHVDVRDFAMHLDHGLSRIDLGHASRDHDADKNEQDGNRNDDFLSRIKDLPVVQKVNRFRRR